jgi:transcriptional regulator with XRE-family HTH domain
MSALRIEKQGATIGQQARRLRIASLLSQQRLAYLAGVPRAHVDLFERSLPVPLDSRRRILKELWAKKTEK